MDPERLREKLEESGELMINVGEIDEPIELHLHDTEIGDELITLELADGTLEFEVDEVVAAWKHYHTLDDYGLD
ncbi:hypothetical protein [Natrarchaeobaculum aegyptiacum]|uniref:Uncharacterized protein n=1 Tax=Natrarchaeobaculum aegyptiacum TaxID=745377 RepID=A0A2Z2HVB1_9EURY|nr:hypothetical protein [Natrarchaeobaculum aegyptiacum]ARS89467.1 hypothetical protein B1756_06715 [Natrarchaeobaculum aegyptiacum]